MQVPCFLLRPLKPSVAQPEPLIKYVHATCLVEQMVAEVQANRCSLPENLSAALDDYRSRYCKD